MTNRQRARAVCRVNGRCRFSGLMLVTITCAWGCVTPEAAREPAARATETRQESPPMTAEEHAACVASFDQVWETVRERHWDPTLGGLDWDAVRAELRPQVEAATTVEAARGIMQAALDRLRQSHFAIIPRDAYEQIRDPVDDLVGEPGLTARVVQDQVLVTEVREGTPAAEAGVQPGWQITHIDGVALGPMVEKIRSADGGSSLEPSMQVRALRARVNGPLDSEVQIGLVDGTGAAVTQVLRRVAPAGALVQFGNMPPIHLTFEARELDGGVGYIRFSAFFDPVRLTVDFQDAVNRFTDAPGIVIDLRGNPGGIALMAMGMAGWFVDAPNLQLGTMRTQAMTLKFVVNPRLDSYHGALAILVDGCTASTAEIFAGGLQDLGRARVFGQRTAGAALPATIDRLPNGDGFLYAIADYTSTGGRRLEGHGVVPDEEIPPDREALLAGRDPVLEAALDWILSR